jgi:rhodanese-related sulfurtransferase/predicted double-glycine peptidase
VRLTSFRATHCMLVRIAVFCAYIGSLCQVRIAQAQSDSAVKAADNSSLAYCGIYCLYAASLEFHSHLTFNQLLRDEYVSSRSGSSLLDLERAVTDNGLYCVTFQNGSLRMLRSSKNPVILHITASIGIRDYNHYVLLLKATDNNFVVLDPGQSAHEISANQLSASWDGSGLVLSDKPIQTNQLFLTPWLDCVIGIVSTLLILLGLRWIVSKIKWLTGQDSRLGNHIIALRQAIVIVTITIGMAVGYNSIAATGFIRNPQYVQDVQQAHIASFLPRVSLEESRHRVDAGALLIDARYASDYNFGHISGAINLPVNSSLVDRSTVLSQVDRMRPIIIYCQNSDCPYSQSLAALLIDDGYKNLYLLNGGYDEWKVWTNGLSK